jgi:hypothetical protein
METVEHFAEITLAAKILGGPAPLSQEEVRKLLHVREKLGLGAAPDRCVACGACAGAAAEGRSDGGPGAVPPDELRGRDGEAGGPSPGARPTTPEVPEGGDEAIVRAVIREVEKRLGSG